jgi:hypothetical protein
LKYREENVNGIKDDKRGIKEDMKKLKEKLIQRINQIEKELTNKLDILVQENTKIQQDEIDIEGTYLTKITLSTGSNTRHLSIGHNNQIYYSTPSSINCVNCNGTEVFSYKIPNENDHRKIAINRNGNVYVAGKRTNTIQRLHSDGTVDCVILNEGDGVKQPLSICFNKSCDKLYMANMNSCVVHVYACS